MRLLRMLAVAVLLAGCATQTAPVATPAPSTYPVRERVLDLANGPDRPLRTTVYHPVGDGPFPVVVFSHGYTCNPGDYQALLTEWAAAGFVVAAPVYPYTHGGATKLDIMDVLRQPSDASHVLTQVLALDGTAGDPLSGKLDRSRIAAAGHSLGGMTTVGMLGRWRDPRVRGGIVLGGNARDVGTGYSGAPASLLFIHGQRDTVLTYASARAAYDAVPAGWPKAFLTLPAADHMGPFSATRDPAFTAVARTTIDFLRWMLRDDTMAKSRLAEDASPAGTIDDRLGGSAPPT